jgi:hypothetical protein
MNGNSDLSSGELSYPAHIESDNIDGANQFGEFPMQFIRLQGGKLEVVEETAQYLSSFTCPIAVIGIVGVVGSGKSYLLNRFVLLISL